MKILFCTDGSNTSYNAINNFSNWTNSITVDILSAIDWSFLPDTASVEDSEFALKCTNSAQSILDKAEAFLLENSIAVGKKIKMCGSAVDCIFETCENNHYDYIVLGSNGKKGIQKWLGSVSQEIASISKVSTFISKDTKKAQSVLFALDSSDVTKNVVKKAISQLDLADKIINLVTVFEIPDYLFLEGNLDENWVRDISTKQEKFSMMLLSDFEKMFNENNLNINSKTVLSGNPSTSIINYADKNEIDLIICGVRNRKFLSKMLLSSVSKRILENSKSDVLIIRP